MKLTIKEILKLNNPQNFAEIIYNNFIYLANKEQLQHNMQEITRLLTDDNMFGYLVYDNKRIIAYLIGETKYLNDGRTVFYISYIYTLPKYRSKSVGSYIIDKLINKCREVNTKYILLTYDITDQKLCNFYNKFGFEIDNTLKTNTNHEVFYLSL